MEQLVPERLAVRVKACYQSSAISSTSLSHFLSYSFGHIGFSCEATFWPTSLTNGNPFSLALGWYAQLNKSTSVGLEVFLHFSIPKGWWTQWEQHFFRGLSPLPSKSLPICRRQKKRLPNALVALRSGTLACERYEFISMMGSEYPGIATYSNMYWLKFIYA